MLPLVRKVIMIGHFRIALPLGAAGSELFITADTIIILGYSVM
jgi:hypothetical protein